MFIFVRTGAEATVILVFGQQGNCTVHLIKTEAVQQVKRTKPVKKRVLIGVEIVVVCAFYGIKACMWKPFHSDDVKYSNVVREQLIQAELKVKIPGPFDIHMKEELTRMHMRISSSTTNYKDRFFKYLANCLLNYTLYVRNARLFLPASIMKTIVCNVNEVPQGLSLSRPFV